jgi:hypothetical protein
MGIYLLHNLQYSVEAAAVHKFKHEINNPLIIVSAIEPDL